MRIGIDLGGTKIEGIALDENGRELIRHRVATPVGDYQGTLTAISGLIAHIENSTGLTGSIGVGTPGSLSPATSLLRNSNSVCMNGQPVKQDLEKLIQREIRITNDANCFALSEAIDGAAKGAASVFGVIVGTGTGAGVVINGKALIGLTPLLESGGITHCPGQRMMSAQDLSVIVVSMAALKLFCLVLGCPQIIFSIRVKKNPP